MTVSVRFIGSGNAFADGGRSHACILVRAPGTTLLLDCGGSSLPPLKRVLDPGSIDAIAISHLHGDHFGGLPYLILEQHFKGRTRPLTIAGPPDLEERTRAALAALFADFVSHHILGFPLRFLIYGGEPIALGGAMVGAMPVLHVPSANPHGIRVEVGGKVIAYTGDCRWSDAIPALARGADLFICEATGFAGPEEVHLSYSEIEAHRSELGRARIVLTHLGDDALAHVSLMTIEHAVDGTVIDV